MNPTISVLIPSYNGEKYIGEAIKSVISQSYQNFELIIFDDQSVDKTNLIIKDYVKKDQRIRYRINKKNIGCSHNINSLLLEAKGKYIKILIQDDMLHPEYLQDCANILDINSNVVLVTTFQQFIGKSNDTRVFPTIPYTKTVLGKDAQRSLVLQGNWIGGETATMFRKANLYVGLWNPSWDWQVDQDMWLRLLSTGDLYVIPQILSYSRIHQEQATVYLNKDYRFIKEELEELRLVFSSEKLYGKFTRTEKTNLLNVKLFRLLNEYWETHKKKSFKPVWMIGYTYVGYKFIFIMIKFFLHKIKKLISP